MDYSLTIFRFYSTYLTRDHHHKAEEETDEFTQRQLFVTDKHEKSYNYAAVDFCYCIKKCGDVKTLAKRVRLLRSTGKPRQEERVLYDFNPLL